MSFGMFLAWVVIGGLAGWLAGLVVRGTGLGLIGDLMVGIVGAVLAGFVLSLIFPGTFGFTGFNFASLIIAFIGAVVLLLIVRFVKGGRMRAAR